MRTIAADRASGVKIRAEAGAQTRAEAQLRARVEELEARVDEVTRCLEDAERRAAELDAVQARARTLEESANARIEQLERRLSVITTSRSWRMTKPVRDAVSRLRGSTEG